jgi:hypothetical protein
MLKEVKSTLFRVGFAGNFDRLIQAGTQFLTNHTTL